MFKKTFRVRVVRERVHRVNHSGRTNILFLGVSTYLTEKPQTLKTHTVNARVGILPRLDPGGLHRRDKVISGPTTLRPLTHTNTHGGGAPRTGTADSPRARLRLPLRVYDRPQTSTATATRPGSPCVGRVSPPGRTLSTWSTGVGWAHCTGRVVGRTVVRLWWVGAGQKTEKSVVGVRTPVLRPTGHGVPSVLSS